MHTAILQQKFLLFLTSHLQHRLIDEMKRGSKEQRKDEDKSILKASIDYNVIQSQDSCV